MSDDSNKAADTSKKDARQRSSIQFPYADLDSCIEIAKAIYEHAGHGSGSNSQVAAWVRQSAKSSGFNLKMSASRMFGLIDTENGNHQLTDLGKRIVADDTAREAKVEAFLNVPLYESVFKSYDGHGLPPSKGIENDIVGMGVAEKVKDRARQYLEKSAEQAGFFENGRNRLVKPTVQILGNEKHSPAPKSNDTVPQAQPAKTSAAKTFHPFIDGLLEELPSKGEPWPKEKQEQWLATAKSIFGMIYKDTSTHNKVVDNNDDIC